jgi:hypothetical protein
MSLSANSKDVGQYESLQQLTSGTCNQNEKLRYFLRITKQTNHWTTRRRNIVKKKEKLFYLV